MEKCWPGLDIFCIRAEVKGETVRLASLANNVCSNDFANGHISTVAKPRLEPGGGGHSGTLLLHQTPMYTYIPLIVYLESVEK